MIRVLDDWTKCLDQGALVDIVYLDFIKVFYKVSRDYRIQKLLSLGIGDKILYWLLDFLNDRFQFVSYNDCTSISVKIGNGVPQGSVIGPASFVTFINDLPYAVSSKIYEFADDTKMFKGIVSDADRQCCNQTLNISSNGRVPTNLENLELSGNFINLEKSGKSQGI